MQLEPIAFYHCPIADKFGIPRQSGLAPGLHGEIVLCAPFARPEAMKGLSEFSHIWLIWEFNLNSPGKGLTVRPPRLGGNERVGVFASRSPFRPNPLGLSAVRIESIDSAKGIIAVSGADLADGTPIYDIKPYVPYSDCIHDAKAGFTSVRWDRLSVVFDCELDEELTARKDALVQLLELDPRPQYQDDPHRLYGLSFAGRDIHFRVEGRTLHLIDISSPES